MSEKVVRIGCCAGFWGDSRMAAPQLVKSGEIDYLVGDYLAEVTMSILARMRAKSPEAGYAVDFVTTVMKPLIKDIAERKIKVVTNAGGVNVRACRDAIQKIAADAGVALKVFAVEGDDLIRQADELRKQGVTEIASGAALPEKMVSINAYLGATPIAAALERGADIVITGRCVDSAMALGPLMYEFGWTANDYDKLALGSLAGHVIECGAQATGGLFTDWEEVPDWENIGYPIVDCREDGSFTVTKPNGTGGLVSTGTVAEQIIYEIGDPAAYKLADVTCDFTSVSLEQAGENRVTVSGAKGRSPSPTYKVSGTYGDGYRCLSTALIAGFDADKKARRVAETIINRTRAMLKDAGARDYRETSIEIIGVEDTYGKNSRLNSAREVVMKIGVRHDSFDALQLFAGEVAPAATSMAQGLTGLLGGRPKPSPVVRHFPFLLDKSAVPVSVTDGEQDWSVEGAQIGNDQPGPVSVQGEVMVVGEGETVPLRAIAHGRSGDKGNDANIGIIARDPEFLPVIRGAVTVESVADYFAHILEGPVTRFEMPGISALNFLLTDALGGGGVASLRYDPQGKTYAQMLLDLPVTVPAAWLADGRVKKGDA